MIHLDEAEQRSFERDRQIQLIRRRADYKDLHKGTANKKGCLTEFMNANTITQMRKILWGERRKK